MVVSSIASFGRYCVFISQVFKSPDKWKEFFKRLVFEISKLGVDSIPLVIIISLFIGAVITIQMTINIVSPLIPSYSTGLATREILLLEFSSTMMSLILAGKVGSNIASEIGTMRVTEQIDALDIMGINSANFVVLPKIIGFVLFVPVLCILSMFMGLVGGWFIAEFTTMEQNEYRARHDSFGACLTHLKRTTFHIIAIICSNTCDYIRKHQRFYYAIPHIPFVEETLNAINIIFN